MQTLQAATRAADCTILNLLSLPLQLCWTNMCSTRSVRYTSSEYNHLLGVQEKYVTNDVVTVLQQYQHTGVSFLYNQESLLVPEGGLNLPLMNPLPDGCLWKATTEKVEFNWRHAQFIEISHNQEYHDNKPMCLGSHKPNLAQQVDPQGFKFQHLVLSCMY